MNALPETTTVGANSIPKTKLNDNLSTDGKWKSFPKVPNLLQYVVAGTYYARCKVKGKPVRASLETDVFTLPSSACRTNSKSYENPKRKSARLRTDGLNTKPKRATATRHAKTDW
jgi:hypothetical protein